MLFRSTWTNQPPQLVDIDRGHPLGKDVAFACLPTGSAPSLAGSVALGNGPRGKHWLFPNAPSTTATVNFGAAAAVDVLSQSPGWAMVVFNPGDSAQWSGAANFIANKSDANVTTGWTLYHSSVGVVTLKLVNASANKSVVTTSGAITSRKWCVLIYDHGGSTTAADGSRIFVDGVDRTSSSGTGTGAHPTDAAWPLQLGLGPYGAVNSSVGQFALAAFGRKRLSAQEIAALTANPWQIFAPTSRKIWVPGVAGSSHTLVGANSTQTNTSGTGAISQTHVLAGAASTQANTSGTGTVASGTASITPAAGTSTTSALTGSATAAASLTQASGVSTSSTLAATGIAVASITQAAGTSTAATIAATGIAPATITTAAGASLASILVGSAAIGDAFTVPSRARIGTSPAIDPRIGSSAAVRPCHRIGLGTAINPHRRIGAKTP